MSNHPAAAIVQKLCNYRNVLRDKGSPNMLRARGVLVRLDSRTERRRLAAAAWSGGLLIGLIILITACRSGGGKAGAAVHAGAAAQPSILLVLVDALRPDHLGCYGYGRPTSPVLDRLASRSVLFENARSVSSWTKPSIPSLFTSLYPSQHGVFEGSVRKKGGAPESDVLPAEATTLAEALKECGYATAAFVHNDQLHRQFGFDQGFDLYEETSEDAPAMIHRMLEWLGGGKSRQGGPFFVYLHLLDVHWPYNPPAEAARAIGAEVGATGDERVLRDAVNRGLVKLSPAETDRLVRRYDAEIRAVDGAFAKLLSGLLDLGLLDRMLLVVTADHGEEFLEHGYLGHGDDLYEESLRIPLIVRLPGEEAAGQRIAASVSSLDLMPTFLEAASCAAEGMARLEGRSLLGNMRGHLPLTDSAAYAEVKHKRTIRQAISKDGWKLIRTVHSPSENAARVTHDGSAPLVGRRFEAEGSRLGEDRFVASEVQEEPSVNENDEVSGKIETLDLDGRSARVTGYSVELGNALVQGPAGEKKGRESLHPDLLVKVEGRAAGAGRFLAQKIRLLEGEPRNEIGGIVRRVLPPANPGSVEMEIAGLRVLARRKDIRGLSRTSAPTGDPARRPASAPEIKLEVYDLRKDPGEHVDLSLREPERVRALLSDLEAWQKRIDSRRLPPAERSRVDEETVKRLRALGYVQ